MKRELNGDKKQTVFAMQLASSSVSGPRKDYLGGPRENVQGIPYQALMLYDSNWPTVLLSCHLLPVQCTQFIRSRTAGTAGDAAELNNTVEAPPPTNHTTYQQQQIFANRQHRIQEGFFISESGACPLNIIHTAISPS